MSENITYGLSTLAIHADAGYGPDPLEVSPAISVSTIWRYPENPDEWKSAKERAALLKEHADKNKTEEVSLAPDAVDPNFGIPFIYSRDTQPVALRVERTLSKMVGAHVVSYRSGLAAAAALITHLNPKRISIGDGYHGTHGVISVLKRLSNVQVLPLDCAEGDLHEGDLIWLETPVNPLGTSFDIEAFAKKAHGRGAWLVVDSTFAPPPLQDPFQQGADYVHHSATKYFGGHSDLLAGLILTKSKEAKKRLISDRLVMGNLPGSLEAWLLLRSLRTYALRIERQSRTAEALANLLDRFRRDEEFCKEKGVEPGLVIAVTHSSLQGDDFVKKQMPGGYGPVLSLSLVTASVTKRFPGYLKLFFHSTSLGGTESLVEWRAMSDPSVDDRLIRMSVGCEDTSDLERDITLALVSCGRFWRSGTPAASKEE
ncbi:hypothetical protein PROFUN_08829 [Planoprotostelium fungivorum]|uniref:Cystathionine gamma-synthase n=1 Tax=Planoprotostelium fungivorum TaxID=1890364 RepID=A0A2P6NIX6_9EUKA|nr:hypothetical protein PROFUN_08829 [Planoprotostelium fungivorum]